VVVEYAQTEGLGARSPDVEDRRGERAGEAIIIEVEF
jgi:hypothetical protein